MDPLTVSIIVASINGGCLVISEILGLLNSNKPTACKSIIGFIGSVYNYATQEKTDEQQHSHETIELKNITPQTALEPIQKSQHKRRKSTGAPWMLNKK